MFYKCSSLKELNAPNFNTNNVIYMSCLFYKCSSLKELNIANFNTDMAYSISDMFEGCTMELKDKIKELNNNNIII